nr:urokinase plasminogen activator surface receptor-like isoform X2 [Misgurnus anguillicaudatus]
MDLKIFIVLFCALFTGGHSLQCYECLGIMGSCESKETTCPDTATATCASATVVQTTGGTEVKMQSKGCTVKEGCISASVNFGVARTVTSTQCCNTDRCNSNDAPVYGSNSPNGKQCYYCDGKSCFNKLNCLGDEDYCLKATGETRFTKQAKACDVKQNCVNGSINFGLGSTGFSMQCCNTDLCNSKDVPDYNSYSPNGKQCYYCDDTSCLNKLNCLGSEDSCITAKVTASQTVKGCITKTICDSASQASQGFKDFTCCQGNLCNGAKSITQNLLFLSWPFFFYILIH